jgi:hypothetical protein
MTALPPGYDAWRLEGPPESDEPGRHEGETCGRLTEPDEDAPRNWRPRPCGGVMIEDDGETVCDTCGELA